ncbi:MAG: ribulose-phosphate 3-epimerase [Puniceicoccales bacterium]|jgi:ribulose-phosphate 3-epimerase|nr:ribulose-phosphate 3-epimerase [Puniceicoccales bacterium]
MVTSSPPPAAKPPPSQNAPILAPSILAGNHAALGESLAAVTDNKLPWLHLDIMDAHFVPNLSFGPQTLAALRPLAPSLYFDTHLMLDQPQNYITPFASAGANGITIHIESQCPHPETLLLIRELGLRPGIALNPETPPSAIRHLLHLVELVLVMTVHPGFGGQAFIPDTLQKITTLAQWRSQSNAHWRIQADGGITPQTALAARQAGADTLVAGTSFFRSRDKQNFIAQLLRPLVTVPESAP